MVGEILHGNGIHETIVADSFRPGRPASITVSSGGSPLWATNAYAYDGAGNVSAIGASRFAYDGVSRLREAALTATELSGNELLSDGFETGDTSRWPGANLPLTYAITATESARFDPFGNLTRREHTVNGGVPEVKTLAADPLSNRLIGSTVDYDAAGNLTRHETHLYRYDAFNQVSQIDYPNWTYLYTADEERLWQLECPGSCPDPGFVPTLRETWTVIAFGQELARIFGLKWKQTT